MPAKEPPVSRQAEEPFNKRNADVILRTSDMVDFCVWRGILAEASPFFDDMFSLPQAGSKRKRQAAGEIFQDGKPVISVTETSKTLRSLLLFCYPQNDPVLEENAVICDVLEAARKYDMEDVAGRVLTQFVARTRIAPWEMFALAYKQRWGDEMLVAARASLAFPPLVDCPSYFADVPTAIYFKLCNYRKNCVDAVRRDLSTADTEYGTLPCLNGLSSEAFAAELGIEERCSDCSTQAIAFDVDCDDVPEYVAEALSAMDEKAAQFPHGSAINNSKWISETVASLAPEDCAPCCSQVHNHIAKCASLVAKRIDFITSSVKLDISL